MMKEMRLNQKRIQMNPRQIKKMTLKLLMKKRKMLLINLKRKPKL
jgi:hypothetical protein